MNDGDGADHAAALVVRAHGDVEPARAALAGELELELLRLAAREHRFAWRRRALAAAAAGSTSLSSFPTRSLGKLAGRIEDPGIAAVQVGGGDGDPRADERGFATRPMRRRGLALAGSHRAL